MIDTDVLVVGGGLAGVALAGHLQFAGVEFRLTEARPELGGRVRLARVAHGGVDGSFDLGPSWFWPGQERMERLARRLGSDVFEQYAAGALLFEEPSGEVVRAKGFSSMRGALRVAGGLTALTSGLGLELDSERVHLGWRLETLRFAGGAIEARFEGRDVPLRARRAVLALPPRIAAALGFEPALPTGFSRALEEASTWMAGQAKFVAVYEEPFWREDGLSGDAMSRVGPLSEVHDATDPVSGLGALFGFVGVPATQRPQDENVLIEACRAQLGRLFGAQALDSVGTLIQDWARDDLTATSLDAIQPPRHPQFAPAALQEPWEGRLYVSSTETAARNGGLLEGALEAAQETAAKLIRTRSSADARHSVSKC